MKKTLRLTMAVMVATLLALTQRAIAIIATGGTVTDTNGYRIHTFTGSGTLTVTAGGNAEVLVVGGGGGGGQRVGGGGGAGGLVYATSYFITAGTKTITVGNGGAGATANGTLGVNGQDSVFDVSGGVGITITAKGGGASGSYNLGPGTGGSGGSGGGGNYSGSGSGSGGAASQGNSGVSGAIGYGFAGGISASGAQFGGGGGGGAGGVGSNATGSVAGNGGMGIQFLQFAGLVAGSPSGYFAGGGGAGASGGTAGTGGLGGGGNGKASPSGSPINGDNGVANTGGGGGGGSDNFGNNGSNGTGGTGGNGGSGIVIVRYLSGIPSVSNVSALVAGSSVTLNGHLVSTGQDANISTAVYWGTNDAGSVLAGWTHTNLFFGVAVIGPLSTNVMPGGSAARYYFRFSASNSFGYALANPVGSFSTTGAPSINNAGGAINVGPASATMQGEVTGGSPAPSTWIYWGTVNRGANKDLWEHTNAVGVVSNWTFAATVGGLTPGATYYYSCYASNSYGEAWATVSNFTCLGGASRIWNGAGADALASNPTNWAGVVAPGVGDIIILDATTSKNMTWNMTNLTVASWTQVGYVGTVTVTTVYGITGFTNFNIVGNCVISNGAWTHPGPQNTEVNRLRVTIGGNLIVGTGAVIDVMGKGYAAGQGPGAALGGGGGGGGSYGGRGDYSFCTSIGPCYGSIMAPTNLGSGSGFGAGGGVITMTVSGQARIDGLVSADGSSGATYAGAGGSIWLTSGTLAGGGIIRANGGSKISQASGGGGRIALVLTQPGADFSLYPGSIQAYAGDGGWNAAGGAGTIYKQLAAERRGCGTVEVNTANSGFTSVRYTDVPPSLPCVMNEVEFARFVITNVARLRLTNDYMIGDLYLQSANAWLDLGSNTLTIRSREHKLGPGSATNVINRGAIIWWPDVPKGVVFSTW